MKLKQLIVTATVLLTSISQSAIAHEEYLYMLRNGDVTMTIDASYGGRILSLKYHDQEILSQSRVGESFGSTFWTSPQKVWNWPPISEFDKMPYLIVKEDENRMILRSEVSDRLGFSIGKDFQVNMVSGAFDVTYSIKNESNEPRQVAPWEITRVPNADGTIFFEAQNDSIWPADILDFNAEQGAMWYTTDETAQNRKINADGKGWLAYYADGMLLVKRFQNLQLNEPAPNEAEVQVYVNRGKTYIELESQGAYVWLQPGEELSWTVSWYLLPVQTSTQEELLKAVRACLNK